MGHKTYTEDEFNITKKLLNHGLNTKEVMLMTGRGRSVINDTSRFNTYQDYKNYIKEKRLKEIAKKEASLVEPVSFVEAITPPVETPISRANEAKIATNIERMADSLEVIANFINNQTPLNKEAKESWLFRNR